MSLSINLPCTKCNHCRAILYFVQLCGCSLHQITSQFDFLFCLVVVWFLPSLCLLRRTPWRQPTPLDSSTGGALNLKTLLFAQFSVMSHLPFSHPPTLFRGDSRSRHALSVLSLPLRQCVPLHACLGLGIGLGGPLCVVCV